MKVPKDSPRIVIVGAGFGGLNAAKHLAKSNVRLIVIDRKNHHTFQPLLYQVATAGLSPGEIAAPVRWILRGHDNVEVLLEDVLDFDVQRKIVCDNAARRGASNRLNDGDAQQRHWRRRTLGTSRMTSRKITPASNPHTAFPGPPL